LATAHQMCALTQNAHIALWDHLVRLDMMEHLVFERFWVDDPVQHLLADPRRLQWTPHDDLHLRVVDPVAALTARRYAREDSVVIEVRDDACPDITGRYRVEGGLHDAHAERTTADADLVMDGAALGSIYLGDVSIAALHAAGVVEEIRAGAVQRGSAMFAWQPRPQLTYMF
jgi:predicted acetyltransferase